MSTVHLNGHLDDKALVTSCLELLSLCGCYYTLLFTWWPNSSHVRHASVCGFRVQSWHWKELRRNKKSWELWITADVMSVSRLGNIISRQCIMACSAVTVGRWTDVAEKSVYCTSWLESRQHEADRLVFCCFTYSSPWRWRHHLPPKHQLSVTELHSKWSCMDILEWSDSSSMSGFYEEPLSRHSRVHLQSCSELCIPRQAPAYFKLLELSVAQLCADKHWWKQCTIASSKRHSGGPQRLCF
jgi:hypothetical protein